MSLAEPWRPRPAWVLRAVARERPAPPPEIPPGMIRCAICGKLVRESKGPSKRKTCSQRCKDIRAYRRRVSE